MSNITKTWIKERNMEFGAKLREVRKNFNWTQKELAEQMGKSPVTICDWEKGKSRPTIDELARLSSIFNVTTDYLLGRIVPYCPFEEFVADYRNQRGNLRNVTLFKKFTPKNMALLERLILHLELQEDSDSLLHKLFKSVGYRFDSNEDEYRNWEFENFELTEQQRLYKQL